AIAAFNVLEHLYTRGEVTACLQRIAAHLTPGGAFAFDVQLPDLAWLQRDSTRRWARTRFTDPTTGRAMVYSTNHDYDPVSQIALIRLYYEPADDEPDRRAGTGHPAATPTAPMRADRSPRSAVPGEDKRRKGRTEEDGPRHPAATPTDRTDRSPSRVVPGEDNRRKGRTGEDVPTTRVVKLSQRKFFPAELEALVAHAGFRVAERYGDFSFRPLDGSAESQVLVCEPVAKRRRKRPVSR